MAKYAVVTGASSGIGREFAELLAKDGYDLLIAARSETELKAVSRQLKSDYNVKIDIAALDLSEAGAADKLWKKVTSKKVDVLINNAGFGDLHSVRNAEWGKLESMISLNITTLTRLSQLAALSMEKGGGKILNVASIAAFIPGPNMATYYATKAYVLSFSEALSEELSGTGISVTALCPGPTETGFSKAADADSSGLFSGSLPTAKDVAVYGYSSMKNGKVVAVHKLKNKLSALVMPRLLPRFVIRKVVKKIQT